MEEKPEEKKEEEKPVKSKEERKDFLSEARELATRNEKAVNEMRGLVERNEELAAKNILGGKADAGEQPPKKEEETPEEYSKRIISGKL